MQSHKFLLGSMDAGEGFWPDERVTFTLQNLGWGEDDFGEEGLFRELPRELLRRHLDGGCCVWRSKKAWTAECAHSLPNTPCHDIGRPQWAGCFEVRRLPEDHPAFSPGGDEFGLFSRVAIEEGVVLPFCYTGRVMAHSSRMDNDRSSINRSR